MDGWVDEWAYQMDGQENISIASSIEGQDKKGQEMKGKERT